MRAVFGVGTVSCLILSNLVFLCGTDPVWLYIKRMFFDGVFRYMLFLLCDKSCFQLMV